MPEEVEECVDSVLDDNPDYSESRAYAICNAQQKGYDDPEAVAAVAIKQNEGEWPGIHPSEKSKEGRDHLLDRFAEKARELTKELQGSEERVKFKARMTGPQAIFKVSDDDSDRFVIWGKASVEIVDKERDKITAGALKDALPQLLRRKRLSLQHTDQLVGDILENFETDDPVTVEIDGKTYKRSEFPTDVLKLDKDEEPALFVAGEVWDDTRQGKEAREQIRNGELDSYSISGEAISSSTQVKGGDVYDKISEIDLSAVTLTEEGMNQKAKFGTVVKMGDDPVSPTDAGRASTPGVSVIKAQDDMSDPTDDEPDNPGISKDELREEFKSVLDESGFVTKEEVEDLIAQSDDEADYSDDEPSNPSEAAAEDDDDTEKGDYEEDDEEMPETPEDDEKADDEDLPDDDEEMPDEEPEPDAVDPDVIEDPDSDDEEEVDLDPAEDDEEMPPEEEEKGDVLSQLEEEGVPDDLVDAVSEYVGGDEEEEELIDEEPAEPADEEPVDEEPLEMEDDEAVKEDDGAMDKSDETVFTDDMNTDEYLSATASVPSTESIGGFEKSYAVSPDDDDDDEEVEKETGVSLEPANLETFYQEVEGE